MKRVTAAVVALIVLFLGYQLYLRKPHVKNSEPRGQSIICFGDSLTYGTGAPPESSYPAQLGRLIGREVVNAGIPGDTTEDALFRLDRDVLAHDPRVVLITLGGNDLMRDVPKDDAFRNLEQIVRRIQDHGALVVVGGIKIPLIDRGYGKAYKKLRRSTGCLLIPDILDDIMGDDRLMSDRIHPNGKGYEIMAQRFYRAVEPYL